MDEHLLRVGEFLRRTRLSPKALRVYGDRGLLVPARVDGHSGHRWYAPAQVARAGLVGLLRQAGMPLARVREVVDLEPADRLAAVDRWWRDVEADVALRRVLVRSLHRRLAGDDDPPEAPVHDVALRTSGELALLTTQRRLTVEELGSFIPDAARALDEHLAASARPAPARCGSSTTAWSPPTATARWRSPSRSPGRCGRRGRCGCAGSRPAARRSPC